MDRNLIAALFVAALSLLASAILDHQAGSTIRHGVALLLPLAVIGYPSVMDSGFRQSWRGLFSGTEGPSPAFLLQIAAWLLLLALIATHHYMRLSRLA